MSRASCCKMKYVLHVDKVLPDNRAVREPVEVTNKVTDSENATSQVSGDHLHQRVLSLQESRDIVDVAGDSASSHILQLVAHGVCADLKLRLPQSIRVPLLFDEVVAVQRVGQVRANVVSAV